MPRLGSKNWTLTCDTAAGRGRALRPFKLRWSSGSQQSKQSVAASCRSCHSGRGRPHNQQSGTTSTPRPPVIVNATLWNLTLQTVYFTGNLQSGTKDLVKTAATSRSAWFAAVGILHQSSFKNFDRLAVAALLASSSTTLRPHGRGGGVICHKSELTTLLYVEYHDCTSGEFRNVPEGVVVSGSSAVLG